ncbi:MAG: transcriptional regulator, PadR-like family [Propionibacteriaceae bacterium]|nr:transcriptional regulator, PadR-like family [Propionibacteriaceae bacterium]
MPRRSHQLGAADYALLGLLMLGPRHGYELAPYFANDGALGLVCTLGVSRLYALLHALEELGFVHAESSAISGGPPRKVFSLTEAGQAAFRHWLDQPIRQLRLIRQDFLLKLFFSRQLTGSDTATLVERQVAVSRTVANELAARAQAETVDSFAALVYESRLAMARATIAWLEAERDRAAPAPSSLEPSASSIESPG